MPVKHPSCVPTHPKLHARTRGIALVVVLLAAMILMVSLLAISSTMTISAQRTTSDQGATLQAQYAAEAGLARVPVRLGEIQNAMSALKVPDGATRLEVEAHLSRFCGTTFYLAPPATPTGYKLCDAAPPGGASNRYSLFYTYIPSTPPDLDSWYPTPTSQYWSDIFAGTDADAFSGVSAAALTADISSTTSSKATYSVRQGLIPVYVEAVDTRSSGIYRVYFKLAPTTVVGEVKINNQNVANRKIKQENSETIFITVSKPCFCNYMQYRDRTTQVVEDRGTGSDGQLSFGVGERFEGPVHTNDTPGFLGTATTNPLFTDAFTSAASGPRSGSGYLTASAYSRMFTNVPPKFGVDRVELPSNSLSQLRASFGGDSTDNNSVAINELTAAWNVLGVSVNGVSTMANDVVCYQV